MLNRSNYKKQLKLDIQVYVHSLHLICYGLLEQKLPQTTLLYVCSHLRTRRHLEIPWQSLMDTSSPVHVNKINKIDYHHRGSLPFHSWCSPLPSPGRRNILGLDSQTNWQSLALNSTHTTQNTMLITSIWEKFLKSWNLGIINENHPRWSRKWLLADIKTRYIALVTINNLTPEILGSFVHALCNFVIYSPVFNV